MSEGRLFLLLSLLVQVAPSVFSDVLGRGPVQASAGEDVLLSCVLDPPLDVTDLAVQWKLNSVTVHLYTERTDSADDLQDEQFTGRTSMFHHELSRGKISLKLTNVKKEDAGLYSCYVPRLDSPVKTGNVLLRVHSVDPRKELGDSDSPDEVRHEAVQVAAGDDVVLPCRLNPPFNVIDLRVEWTRNGRIVHGYAERTDSNDQDEQFRGRTSMFHREMSRGNISLKLTNVTEEDSGLYFCSVPGLDSQVTRGHVLLSVKFSVVGHESVQASAGEDVVLQCLLKPQYDVSELTVEWTLKDLNVHVYRHRKDDHNLQDEQFRGRTSLFHEEMSRGNISLTLSNVTEEDSGLYSCYVPRLDSQVKRGNIRLSVVTVGGVSETVQDKDDQTGATVGLVSGLLLLIVAVSAVIIWSFRRRRRERRKQKDNERSKAPDTEEKNPLNDP